MGVFTIPLPPETECFIQYDCIVIKHPLGFNYKVSTRASIKGLTAGSDILLFKDLGDLFLYGRGVSRISVSICNEVKTTISDLNTDGLDFIWKAMSSDGTFLSRDSSVDIDKLISGFDNAPKIRTGNLILSCFSKLGLLPKPKPIDKTGSLNSYLVFFDGKPFLTSFDEREYV